MTQCKDMIISRFGPKLNVALYGNGIQNSHLDTESLGKMANHGD